MTLSFNMDEILKIAEQIERNGSRFYRRAAESSADEASKSKLLELADMEDSHEKTFALMRSELSGRETQSIAFDPNGEAEQYLMAMADGNVFDRTADPADLVAGIPLKDLLSVAIGLEKDSILFYLGLRDLIPETRGREKVDGIVKEEMSHVVLLRNQIAALG